jgi:hypothetical protein
MDNVKTKITLYKKILPLFSQYADQVSNSFDNTYTVPHLIKEQIDIVQALIAPITDKDAPVIGPDLDGLFWYLDKTTHIDMLIDKLHASLDIDTTSLSSGMSNTFITGVSDEFKGLTVKHMIFKAKNNAQTTQLLNKMVEIASPIIDTAEGLYNLLVEYPNAVDLFVCLIQISIDNDTPHAEAYLEKAKDFCTSGDSKATPNDSKATPNDSNVLQRFGLIPRYQHLTPAVILRRMLDIVQSEKKVDRKRSSVQGGASYMNKIKDDTRVLASKCAENRIGLYVMVQISSSQIEYDLRTLTIKSFAEQHQFGQDAGLNKKVISKFDLIKNIKQGVDPLVGSLKLGKRSANRWLVIRTLNGIHYDVMSKGVSKSRNDIFINRMDMVKLDRPASSRVAFYHKTFNDVLLGAIKPPQEAIIFEEQTIFGDMSNKVEREVIKHVDEKYLKAGNIKKGDLPKSLADISNMVADDDIEDIVTKVLLMSWKHALPDGPDDPLTVQHRNELSSTFISNLNAISKKFVRNIREGVAKSNMTEFMFRELTTEALIHHIRFKITSIIKSATKKVFDPRQDIYQKILLKKNLLKVEL